MKLRAVGLALAFVPAMVSACKDATPLVSVTADAALDVMSPDVPPPPADTGPPPPVDAGPPPPFDAGPPPTCTAMAVARHAADRPSGVRATELAGIVATTDGALVAWRDSDPRTPDAGTLRDQITVLPIHRDGTSLGDPVAWFDGTPTASALSQPSLLRSGAGALVLAAESRGVVGAAGYVLHLLGSTVTARAVVTTPAVLRDRISEPQAVTLPNGSHMLIAPRLIAPIDAGVVAATPIEMHLSATGEVLNPPEVDLNVFVPIEARYTVLRAAPNGAVFAYVNGADLGVIRFNAQGTIDAHGPYTTPELNAPVLDDAVAFDDALVTVWSEQTGTSWAVRAAVTSLSGGAAQRLTLDTFDGPSRPLVSATRSFGGAAITWIQGAGTAARVRYAVVQPDGIVRSPAADLVAAPNAEGRVVTTAEGRELLFAARDSIAGRAGVAYGRGCLP